MEFRSNHEVRSRNIQTTIRRNTIMLKDKKWLIKKIKNYTDQGDKETALKFLNEYNTKIDDVDYSELAKMIQNSKKKRYRR